MGGVCFDIHGDVIQDVVAEKVLQNIGTAAVGIQFYGIAQGFNLMTQGKQAFLKGGLTARDHDTVQKTPAVFEHFKNFYIFYGMVISKGLTNQIGIMAVRAPEIAAPKKKDATDHSGIVDEGVLLKASDNHGLMRRPIS